MKTNHQQFCMALFAATMLVLLASVITYADNIYVSCYGSGMIEKFDSSGNRSTFASGLYCPLGLAFDSGGNLYVADESGGGTITKFDSSGHGSTFVSGPYYPLYLAFDSGGNLYATSYFYGTLEKFDSSGYMSTIASGLYPQGIAFDGSSNLYVASGDGIAEFDSSGDMSIFASGLGIYHTGLAFDRSGNLYAANWDNGTIAKFDSSGHMSIFASGLNWHEGLAFDSSGNLYAANFWDGKIEKFDSSGNMSLFATGLSYPLGIAVQVPEPATLSLLGLGALSLIIRKKKNHLFILTITIIVTCLLGTHADAATIIGESVSIDYYGYAFLQEPVSQSMKVEVRDPGVEFIAKAPVSLIDLFSIDISEKTITITGLNDYSDDMCLDFEWKFVVDSSSPIAFNGARLVSSSLFSLPPFTFPVNPDVSFDSTTSSIAVSRFLPTGGNAMAVVNEGGQAIIEFTIVPEPATLSLLGLGGIALLKHKGTRT